MQYFGSLGFLVVVWENSLIFSQSVGVDQPLEESQDELNPESWRKNYKVLTSHGYIWRTSNTIAAIFLSRSEPYWFDISAVTWLYLACIWKMLF